MTGTIGCSTRANNRKTPTRPTIMPKAHDVMEGHIEPGCVFDPTVDLDGYRAMNDREALKVLVRP